MEATVQTSTKFYRKKLVFAVDNFWIPPVCPNCFGVLSEKMASDRLVCLICSLEFELKPINREVNHFDR